MSTEHYLGDGLYASLDDFGSVILRAPRKDGDHWVALEPDVLEAFQRWLDRELGRRDPLGEALNSGDGSDRP